MTWHHIVYLISLIITAAIMGFVAWYSRRQRHSVAGAGVYMWIALLVSLIALFQIISMLGPTEEWALFWFNLRITCFAAISVLWLMFVFQFSGKPGILTKPRIALLFVVPLVTQAMLWTNDWHGLWVVREVAFLQAGPFFMPQTSVRVSGLFYRVHYLYTFGMMLAGLAILFAMSVRMQRPYRGQAVLVCAGTLVMIVGALFPSFNLVPGVEFNPLPQGFALGSLVIAWGLFRYRFLAETPRLNGTRTLPAMLVLVIAAMSIGIVATGYLYFRQYESRYRVQVEHEMDIIAQLKVDDLVRWRAERMADADLLYRNDAFTSRVDRLLNNRESGEVTWQVRTWLEKIRLSMKYHRILLLDAMGTPILSFPDGTMSLCPTVSEQLPGMRRLGVVTFLDFHRDAPGGMIHLSLVIPVKYDRDESAVIGFVVMIIDPAEHLYRGIGRWPTTAMTAETLLVRREGDSVVYLNELRYRKNSALSLRFPLSMKNLPAAMAVLGREGVVEGIDYRGVPVVAALRSVPGSPWYLVARMDQYEVYAPVRERFWVMIVVVMALLAGMGMGVGLLWRRQGALHTGERVAAAELLRASEARLHLAMNAAGAGVWEWDLSTGRNVWSDELWELYGLEPHSLEPSYEAWQNTIHPDDRDRAAHAVRTAAGNGSELVAEWRVRDRDGGERWLMSRGSPEFDTTGKVARFMGIVLDITDRKRSEEALRESEERFRSTLENMMEGCQIIGYDWRYLYINEAATRHGQTSKEELIGRTMMETYPGIEATEMFAALKDCMENRQSRHMENEFIYPDGSSGWFDLSMQPVREGVFVLSVDITERKQAEENLHESEKLFSNAFHVGPAGMTITKIEDGKFINVNESFCAMFEFNRDEVIGHTSTDLNLWTVEERIKLIKRQLESGGLQNYELEARSKSGRLLTVLFSSKEILIKGISCHLTTLIDISDIKRAQEALRESEERLRAIFDASVAGIILVDPAGRITYANRRMAEMLGYPLEDLIGTAYPDHVHPDERGTGDGAMRRLIKGEIENVTNERRFIRADGTGFWGFLSGRRMTDREGNLVSLVGVITDITDLKKAEEEKRKSEELYQVLFSNMLNGLAYCKMLYRDGEPDDFIYLEVNPAFETLTGLKDVAGKKVSEVIPGIRESDPELIQRYGRVASTGIPESFETYVAALEMWFSISAYRSGPDHFVAIFDVITERKRAEEELRSSRAFIDEIIDMSPFAMWVSDRDGTVIRVNRSLCEAVHLDKDEIVGRYNVLQDANMENQGVMPAVRAVFERHEPARFGIMWKAADAGNDGFKGAHDMYIDVSMFPLLGLKGDLTNIVCQWVDITERKRAEEEIRHLNASLELRVRERTTELEGANAAINANALRIEDLYNRAPCGYHSLDETGMFVEINDTELEWLGYTREEVIARKSIFDILTENSAGIFKGHYPKFMEHGQLNDLELEFVRKDGSILPVLVNATAIYDAEGKYRRSRSTIMDFREARRAREDLIRYAHRLEEANGELESFSYSVSHDLRAPLRTIDGFSQAVLEDYSERLDEQGRNYLNRLRAASQRMARLIDDILRLSRIGRADLKAVDIDLGGIAESVLRRLAEQEPDRAVELDVHKGTVAAGDPALLRVVLENLLGNAWKFTSKSADARIEFGEKKIDGERVFFVRDNGAGFDMRYADKLFVPFQRLHGADEFEGTGIGLALVRRIIGRHGGRIWAESEIGKGTTILFTL